jgi:hypothetical protein
MFGLERSFWQPLVGMAVILVLGLSLSSAWILTTKIENWLAS